MAVSAVQRHGISIALACRTFSISETCYRYVRKLSDENDVIADWLVKLTDRKKAASALGGLRSVLFTPTQYSWFWLEPQACVQDLLRTGTQPADTFTQTPAAEEA